MNNALRSTLLFQPDNSVVKLPVEYKPSDVYQMKRFSYLFTSSNKVSKNCTYTIMRETTAVIFKAAVQDAGRILGQSR